MKKLLFILILLISCGPLSAQNTGSVTDANYACSTEVDSVDGLPVYTIVKQMPEFKGGEEARIKFLTDNIRYPEAYTDSIMRTLVYVTFVIDTRGNVTNICILNRADPESFTPFEKESMRVVSLMPAWVPGKEGRKKVPVKFVMPIRYELQ
jgi:protein TonB